MRLRLERLLGLLAITACRDDDIEHCLYAGGDLGCDAGICVLAPRGGEAAGVGDDGCFDGSAAPGGFFHARYGLPARLEARGDAMDLGSVEGLLRRLGDGEREVTAVELERFEGVLVDQVVRVRTLFTKEGGSIKAKRDLEGKAGADCEDPGSGELGAVHQYYCEIDEWLDAQPPGTDTETGTASTGDTDDGTATSTGDTSEPECTENAECMDAELPFCGPDQQCVTCEGMSDPHGACAAVDAELPLCAGGECVECTAVDATQCTGTTPICELETNACVPCTEHEQCGEAACNLYTGACLPGDAVVHVGGRKPDFATLGDAVESFGEGAEGTIVVHGGKATAFNESVTVDGGRLLAFVAAELGPGVEPPRWVRNSGNTPQLTVSADATVLLDGLQLSSNASSMVPGVLVDGGRAWMDRSRIVTNLGGGIVAQAGAELTLRNCFVGDGNNGSNALTVDAAAADVVYTTLGSGFDGFEDVFAVGCVGRVEVAVRNSVLISFDNAAGEISCPTADVTHTASETAIPGTGNVVLGDIQANWFIDVSAGDFHLDTPPVLLTNAAQWRDGDPSSDIDGDLRPGRDGADDYAGADVP